MDRAPVSEAGPCAGSIPAERTSFKGTVAERLKALSWKGRRGHTLARSNRAGSAKVGWPRGLRHLFRKQTEVTLPGVRIPPQPPIHGELPERLNGPVLKTGASKGAARSNRALSAKFQCGVSGEVTRPLARLITVRRPFKSDPRNQSLRVGIQAAKESVCKTDGFGLRGFESLPGTPNCGRSSAVERHVAIVDVEGSTPSARSNLMLV